MSMKINADLASLQAKKNLETANKAVQEKDSKAAGGSEQRRSAEVSGGALSDRIRAVNQEVPATQGDRYTQSQSLESSTAQTYAHLRSQLTGQTSGNEPKESLESPAEEMAETAQSTDSGTVSTADADRAAKAYAQVQSQILQSPVTALKAQSKLSGPSLAELLS